MSFEEWGQVKCERQPTFKFWFMVLTIILAYLDYIFSLRGGMFEAYKSALANILPYLFANDNTHYSRWGTVHLHDMLTLKDTHPDV